MADIQKALVPDIGDFDGVPVIEILVSVGEAVSLDQSLITLESDKATMEVPAPVSGVIKSIAVSLGDEVKEGALVAEIEVSEAATGDAASAEAPKQAAPKAEEKPAKQAAPTTKAPPVTSSEVVASKAPPTVTFDAGRVHPDQVPYASPSVRKFARELGVELSQVKGTARDGRIVTEDVQAYVKVRLQGGGAVAGSGEGLGLLPWPTVDFSKFGDTETVDLSRIKKISGANLSRNWVRIPHVTQFEDADITDLEAFRKQLGKENPDVKITPLVFLIKAVVGALKAFPHFNASLDASGERLVMKKYFHIGIAVDTPDGLMVPVIRDCDQKGFVELAHELGEISIKARNKKLGPASMQGGCFSISSLGGIGGTAFTPIINAPEVAILGVSRHAMKPVWDGQAFQPRLVLPMSLSYDHRVIDGADAARFTKYLSRVLADMRRLMV